MSKVVSHAPVIVAMLAVLVLALPLPGADVTASLSGTARDASGAVVPGVQVKATHTGTNASHQAVTDDSGVYTLRSLPVGAYSLVAEAGGFKTFIRTGIELRVNEAARADIVLELGALTESVTVSGLSTVVETNTVTLKTVVDERRISELPLNGRNPGQLVMLVAGVQSGGPSVLSDAAYPGAVTVSSSGARTNTTNFILDGGSHNDNYNNVNSPFPNPDALQEFSVQTNSFSAEYGRNAGAIVNAVTKSGTNQLHGSAFEYLRNSYLNATNFFTPGREDGLKRNQYGGTLGGPIVVPKLFNGRDRMFFFFSYQGTKVRQAPGTSTAIVATAAQRQGDFSSLLPKLPLRDPVTRQPFPNNQIPASLFDPPSQKILEHLPVATDPSGLIRYGTPVRSQDDQYLSRGDYNWTKNKLSVRASVFNYSTPAYLNEANYLSTSRSWAIRSTSVALNDTHIFGPTAMNNFVATFNRTNSLFQPKVPAPYSAIGIKNVYNDGNPQWYFSVSGFFDINTGDTNEFTRNDFQWSDTVRWTRGRHEMSFGAEVVQGRSDITNNYYMNGRFGYRGTDFTGSPLADFLLGRFASLEQGAGEYRMTRSLSFGSFFQDNIRLTSRLTVNLGLRYDPFFPYTDVKGRLAVYRPGLQSARYPNAPTGLLFPGDPGVPDGGYKNDMNNWAPRVGLAWDPFGNGKSSVRAAYGVYYDRKGTQSANTTANQAPFSPRFTRYGDGRLVTSDPYAAWVNPFPVPRTPGKDAQFVLPDTAFSYDPDLVAPQLQTWHLTLERQFLPGWLMRAAYAGSKGTHLLFLDELNPAIYTPGASTATTNQRRPLAPAFGKLTNVQPTSNSTYHSLQLTLDKRFTQGFSILTAYTWSKSIDDTSENKGTEQTVLNPFNLRQQKGLAGFDHRHRMTTSAVWEIPWKTKARLADLLLAYWTITGIATLQTGAPLTMASGVDNARSGTGGQLADIVGNPYLPQDRPRGERILAWFNRDAFATNALGTFGNCGRGIMGGPGSATVDLGIFKDFPFTETAKAQFRFEAFNALNRVNLNGPNTSQNSSTFGRITSAGSPRILQLALRLMF